MPVYLTINYLLSAFLSLVLGIFSLRQNPDSPANRSFFLFTISQFFWIIGLYFGYYFALRPEPESVISTISIRLAFGFGILMDSILSIFFYYFPRTTFNIPKSIRRIYIFSIIFFVSISVFTLWVHKTQIYVNGHYDHDIFGPLYAYYAIFSLLYLLIPAFITIKKITELSGIEKNKMLVSAIGCWTFVFVAAMTNVVLPMFNVWKIGSLDIKWLIKISPLFSLFFIIPTFYSIHKHRFFNFSNISLNFLRKTILYSFSLSLAYAWFHFSSSLYPNANIDVLGLGSVFVGMLSFGLLGKGFPEFITGSLREFRNAIAEFRSAIYACDTYVKLHNMIERLFLIRLNFVNAKIFVIRDTGNKLDRIPVYTKDRFTEELKNRKKDILIKDEIQFYGLKPETIDILTSALQSLEADLCLPLFLENNLIGFFALKKKESEAHYPQEEITELLKIKKDLGIGLMNILLKMDLQEESNLMKIIIDRKTEELRKKFNAIKCLLELQLKQQSDFISLTAHEFRTPLTIAMLHLEEALGTRKEPAELIKDLKIVDSSLDNLKNLTQRLFDVQRYDLNKVKPHAETTDIKELIKAIFDDFLFTMKGKKIDFALVDKLTPGTCLAIDPLLIRQVLENLLTNAHKFIPPESRVILQAEERDQNILIRVTDNGKGVPDSLKKFVFDKFRTSKPDAGIGLGLYICKKIIELHKGKISVEDSEGGGATFCIRLPKDKPASSIKIRNMTFTKNQERQAAKALP